MPRILLFAALCPALAVLGVRDAAAQDAAAAAQRNATAVQAIRRTALAQGSFSDTRRTEIATVIAESLSAATELDPDKTVHVTEHAEASLPGFLRGTSDYTEDQFAVVRNTLRWRLANYVRCQSISEQTRQRGVAALDTVCEVIPLLVERRYAPAHEEMRKRIAEKAVKSLREVRGLIGNYFEPAHLYPRAADPRKPDLLEEMGAVPLLNSVTLRLSRDAEILAVQKGHEADIQDALERREVSIVVMAAMRSLGRLFESPEEAQLRGYLPPPAALVAAQERVRDERQKEAKARLQGAQSRAVRHAGLMNELLDDSGIQIREGIICLPANLTRPE